MHRFAAILATVFMAAVSCKTLQSAAAKDPVKCERDPSCSGRSEKSRDCATQCSDEYECMKRCQQIQNGVDKGP